MRKARLLIPTLGAAALLGGGALWSMAGPFWWRVRGAVSAAPASDHAVALAGQGKHFAASALRELEEQLGDLGGAGDVVHTLVAAEWFRSTERDGALLQIGQLKTLSRPFYDRLYELNVEPGNLAGGEIHPWTADPSDDSDSAPATLGQLKHAFSFDLDRDGDGLPDWWEQRTLGTLEQNADSDGDGDGLTVAAERKAGTNPQSADTDGDGRLDGADSDPAVFGDPLLAEREERLEVMMPLVVTKENADALHRWVNERRAEEGLPPLPDIAERKNLDRDNQPTEATPDGSEE